VNRQIADETEQKLNAAKAYGGETRAAVEAAKASVVQAESEALSAAAGISTAESRIKVAQANIAFVESMRSYLSLTAPFDGVVTDRRIDPGHFVQPATGNTAPLLKIARDDTVRVFVSVPESEAAYLDVEDSVTIDIPTLRGAAIAGKISRTNYVIDSAHRVLESIVDLDNSNHRLRPGMFATATIKLQEQQDTLTLPATAVFRQGKDAFCFRYLDGKASKTPIQIGIKVAEEFEIVSGITETDGVILNKVSQLKDGQAVDLLSAAK
jgi:RND family efflux transporter MFP subunit